MPDGSRPMRRRYTAGFTVTEMLLVLGIGLVLAVLLVSVTGGAIRSANLSKCAVHLRNIWTAGRSYAADHNGVMPPNQANGTIFAASLRPYLGEEGLSKANSLKHSILVCPADKEVYAPGYGLSYAQNGYIGAASGPAATRISRVVASWEQPARMALYLDYELHYVASAPTWKEEKVALLARRHEGKINVVFGDGHVEAVMMTHLDWNVPNPFWQGR